MPRHDVERSMSHPDVEHAKGRVFITYVICSFQPSPPLIAGCLNVCMFLAYLIHITNA